MLIIQALSVSVAGALSSSSSRVGSLTIAILNTAVLHQGVGCIPRCSVRHCATEARASGEKER